jgi:hypothetical protein
MGEHLRQSEHLRPRPSRRHPDHRQKRGGRKRRSRPAYRLGALPRPRREFPARCAQSPLSHAWGSSLRLGDLRRLCVALIRRRFNNRNRRCTQLSAESRFMTATQNSCASEQRANCVAWLRSDTQPIVGALFVHFESPFGLPGSVLTDDLDELPIARALRIGDDDTIDWCLFPPNAAETNSYHGYSP